MPTAVLDRNMNGLSLHEGPLVTKVAINGFGRIGEIPLTYSMQCSAGDSHARLQLSLTFLRVYDFCRPSCLSSVPGQR